MGNRGSHHHTQPAKTAQDHRDILDAVRSKDVDTARELISGHFHGICTLLAQREVSQIKP
ncbi:FCD domain-containing protein [Glutamicibacter arilaitensis]|uniref:FCD domain-containing protein n=1 Tax=Glutamicibacter arilaitensis TaxID=256701 RepID=UPI003FD59B8D